MTTSFTRGLTAGLFALFVLAGCQTTAEPEPPVEEEAAPAPRAEPTPPPTVTPPARPRVDRSGDLLDADGQPVSRVFYFEFDRAELTSEARTQLDQHARYLRDNGSTQITVYGHTDERGTREYNLALGERRAATVRSYLQSLGVSGRQVNVVSYGEERPVDTRSNEQGWALNRRAEISYR